MKWFHNSGVGKVIVISFAIAIHGLFAAGAYYLGLFLASIIFKDTPIMQQGFAIGYAIMVFAGAMWAFIYSEYAYEDIEAYGNATGHTRYSGYLWTVMIAVAGSELASVLFRAFSTPDILGRYVVLVIGILALVIAFCLGKVIHAMANRPFEVSVMRARENAGRSIIEDATKYVDKMTVDEKKRFYTGDLSAIEDASGREQEKLQVKETSKEEKQHAKETKKLDKQRREQIKQNTRTIGQAYSSQLLNDPSQPVAHYPNFQPAQSNPGNHLSQQNGKHANLN